MTHVFTGMKALAKLLAALALSAASATAAPSVATPPTIPAVSVVEVDRAQVRAALAKRRDQAVAAFLAYREARSYPRNDMFSPVPIEHVWIDGQGRLCAAATIISKDWGRDATIAVGRQQLDRKMADATGELADWILTSGLTRAEIVAIQAPMVFDPGQEEQFRAQEDQRLYTLYTDVERQIRSLWTQNLDLATDELMKRPALARGLLEGRVAGPGRFAKPLNQDSRPRPASAGASLESIAG
jgi:hypothetical protein